MKMFIEEMRCQKLSKARQEMRLSQLAHLVRGRAYGWWRVGDSQLWVPEGPACRALVWDEDTGKTYHRLGSRPILIGVRQRVPFKDELAKMIFSYLHPSRPNLDGSDEDRED